MHPWIVAVALMSVALYVGATLVLGRRLSVWQDTAEHAVPKLPLFAFAAVALHGVLLYAEIVSVQGLRLGFFNAASLVVWVAAPPSE